uniref:Reverse transcriptase domain-containing protein n=1 Tax=Tanacetum cinerariifolium TaxID=118510 RepID=A0A699GHX6_TANCI|nr:hypothetical protein [Tanacetum cinerariifolium]
MKLLKKPFRKLIHDQGNLHDRVNRLRNELDEVQKALDRDPSNSVLRDEEALYVQAFNAAKIDEERFLKQKAKIEWLKVGDSNSAYFYKTMKTHNQRSCIDVITNFNNMEVIGNQIANVFVSHYNTFLGRDMICTDLDSDGLFLKRVFDPSNDNMTTPVMNEEIKKAMFRIWNDKAPGPDGFTKILTNRIIEGIKEVVSDNQSAFVPGRRISNNILITQELMHNYHMNKGPLRCAFKVDTQKVYDTIDWHFLEHILKCFGFHPIMTNLRQGDPLSPYLFTLVMEILTLILQRRVRESDTFRGDLDLAKVIMDSLNEFKDVLRLVPSIPKSTVFFCNVLNHVKIGILNIMPFSELVFSVWTIVVNIFVPMDSMVGCCFELELSSFQQSRWLVEDLDNYHLKELHYSAQCLTQLRIFKRCDLISGCFCVSSSYTHKVAITLRSYIVVLSVSRKRGFSRVKSGDDASFLGTYHRVVSFCGHQYLPTEVIRDLFLVRVDQERIVKRVPTSSHRCSQSPISHFLTPRDIVGEDFTLQANVTDLVENGVWTWPLLWLAKAPNLGLITVPNLNDSQDYVQWRDHNGNMAGFSVKLA